MEQLVVNLCLNCYEPYDVTMLDCRNCSDVVDETTADCFNRGTSKLGNSVHACKTLSLKFEAV